MPTFTHPIEPASARTTPHTARTWRWLVRLTTVLCVLLAVATAAAQTCTSSWPNYSLVNADGTTSTPWTDPTSSTFHTRIHISEANARLASATNIADYAGSSFLVLMNMFGYELGHLADEMGLADGFEVLTQRGIRALDGFVDFDESIDIGYDESGTYCSSLYSITDGSHKGEFLLVVRDAKSGLIKHMEVAPTEDVGRARAHEVTGELDKVMLGPDGCGDMRVGPGC